MESCAISQRATVLGRKWWALAVCLVQAAGHRPCSVPLSGMPLGIVGVRCCCCCRTVRCCYRTAPAVVVAMHHRHRRSVVVSPRPALLCTVAALSCRCRTAGSAVVVSLRCRYCAVVISLHCHYCTVSVVALSGVVAVVPLGTIVAPSSHRRARLCRR